MRNKNVLILTLVAGIVLRYLLQPPKSKRQPCSTQEDSLPLPATTVPDSASVPLISLPLSAPVYSVERPQAPSLRNETSAQQPEKRSFVGFVISWFSLKPNPSPFWVRMLTIGFPALLLAPKLPKLIGLGITHEFSRFCAGLALTYVPLVAYYLFKIVVQAFIDRKIPRELDGVKWLMRFQAVVWFLIIVIGGPAVWLIGWEGKNAGWPFGAGALLAGLVFQFGPMRLLDYVEPTLLRHHRVELSELLELTRISSNPVSVTLPGGEASTVMTPELGRALAHKRNERVKILRKKYGLLGDDASS